MHINKTLPAYNSKENYVVFETIKELEKFVQNNSIQDHQEFWFFVYGHDIIFDCLFDFYY